MDSVLGRGMANDLMRNQRLLSEVGFNKWYRDVRPLMSPTKNVSRSGYSS
jgi:hypothetical protein